MWGKVKGPAQYVQSLATVAELLQHDPVQVHQVGVVPTGGAGRGKGYEAEGGRGFKKRGMRWGRGSGRLAILT